MLSPTTQGFRLSPQQKQLWLQQEEAGSAFVATCLATLTGKLDAAALHLALSDLIAEFEILRTTFPLPPGLTLPLQSVAAAAAPVWDEVDLTSLPAAVQADAIRRRLDAPLAVDWAAGPLLQATLFYLGEEEQALVLKMPALLADTASLRNLLTYLGHNYEHRRHGKTPTAAAFQYADVAAIFNDLLASDDTAAGRAYWEKQTIPQYRLPFMAAAVTTSPFAPQAHTWTIPAELTSHLEQIAADQGTLLPVVLLAAWQLLLARLSGVWEMAVGTAYDGRSYEGLGEALGLFERYLPLTTSWTPETTFAGLLAMANERVIEAFDWQDYADLPPLPYQFAWEEDGAVETHAGITITPRAFASQVSRFQLKLIAQPKHDARQGSDTLQFTLWLDPQTINTAYAALLADQLTTLLQAIAAHSATAVSALPLISPTERQRLVVAFNDTARPRSNDTFLDLFACQVQQQPDTLAVRYLEQTLTYAELDAHANQLAHYLQSLGVRPDSCVGLCLLRSLDLIVGIVGILKAGGTFVPLDPIYPPERTAFILSQAQAEIVVTQAELAGQMPASCRIISLDADQEKLAQLPVTSPEVPITPQSLAYILYTSGSTGRPKGVMIRHASLANLAAALNETIYQPYTPPLGDRPLRISLNAPFVFDGSVKQWVQLANGHTICIIPEEARINPPRFLQLINTYQLDVLDTTPSLLKQLLSGGLLTQTAPGLVLIGGEAIDDHTWAQLAGSEHTRFVNVYGPTEATVNATACVVRDVPDHPALGRPLANVQVYLLDETMQPVPTGAIGEIYLGGAGVARGYLAQPELTAQRFVPNPFHPDPQARLYRSGDLGRWNAAGHLLYVGRADHQVKLHGVRIELGEIESTLRRHPQVRDALTLLHTTESDDYLTAYVVTHSDDDAELTQELRQFLRHSLPEYMLPRYILRLPHIPLTPTGKVDRKALPAPHTQSVAAAAYVAPRNDIERTVVEIWQDALGVDKIGINDNFFDLGGHSLLLVNVYDRLQAAFQKSFPLVEMYRYSTVLALTTYLSGSDTDDGHASQVQDRASRQKEALRRQQQLAQRGRNSGRGNGQRGQ